MNHNLSKIKKQLDKAVEEFNQFEFIENDPIQIAHKFNKKEDIEIASFLSTTIAWGNRKMIIKSCYKMIDLLENAPHDFIMNFDKKNNSFDSFVHRTFNTDDFRYFIISLQNIYQNHGGLEKVFTDGFNKERSVLGALQYFRAIFLELEHKKRVEKHIANVNKNSAGKRLNMFLRWMVRKDENGVDLGIWKGIPMSALMLPLDVHAARVSREMGLLIRKQNDWKAVKELTEKLRLFDASDPVKYDYALFGIGVNKVNFED